MNIVLVARGASNSVKVEGDNVEISIGGSPDVPRSYWLDRLVDVAALCAAECHSNGVSPVVRVGGSTKGYSSLKTNSGVTDLGSKIRFFPWDVFAPMLVSAYNKTPDTVHTQLVSEVTHLPETHLYGEASDESVEQAAIHGDDEALTSVIEVAASEDHSHAARAKSVLAQVPVEELEEWNETHEK